jgi:hypothetical protein
MTKCVSGGTEDANSVGWLSCKSANIKYLQHPGFDSQAHALFDLVAKEVLGYRIVFLVMWTFKTTTKSLFRTWGSLGSPHVLNRERQAFPFLVVPTLFSTI